jgi:hypothetical protein
MRLTAYPYCAFNFFFLSINHNLSRRRSCVAAPSWVGGCLSQTTTTISPAITLSRVLEDVPEGWGVAFCSLNFDLVMFVWVELARAQYCLVVSQFSFFSPHLFRGSRSWQAHMARRHLPSSSRSLSLSRTLSSLLPPPPPPLPLACSLHDDPAAVLCLRHFGGARLVCCVM